MYKNIYHHTMTFKDPLHRSELDDPAIQRLIQIEVTRLNSYYQNASKRQISCKKHLDISFRHEQMFITLETENPLPNPKRKGQCLRQFSVFLINAGFGKYLTSYNPKKLLSA